MRSVEQPGRLVQQGSPKREQAELLQAICTAPRRGLESEEPVRSQSAIGGKKYGGALGTRTAEDDAKTFCAHRATGACRLSFRDVTSNR